MTPVGRLPLALSVLVLLTAACGSTVQSRPSAIPGTPAYDGLSTEAATPPGMAAPGGTAPPGSAPGSVGARDQGTSSGAVGTVPGSTAPASVAHGKDGPGVTATTISIGLAYARNADAVQASLGNSAVTQGDPGAMMHILLDQVNKEGGIAGRRLVPVDYSVDATTSQSKTKSQLEEEQCAAFTQDNHVFAALPVNGAGVLACLHRHGSVGIQAGQLLSDTSAELNRYPEMVDVSAFAMDRLARNLVPVLSRGGYFSPWDTAVGAPGRTPAEVGVILPDQPRFRRGAAVLLASLRTAGVTVKPENLAYFYWPKSAAENGQAVTDIQSYVLKFQTNRVSHVIPLDQNALVFFASAADKQRYHPRYALNSQTAAQSYNGSLVPASQLRGAMGLGYYPATDLAPSDNPDDGPYSNPSRRACIKLLRERGTSFANSNEQAVGLLVCDAFWTLRRLLNGVPKGLPLNQSTVSAAIDRVGSVPSASLAAITYGPHRRDAVSGGWLWRFEESCSCVRYKGSRFALS